MRGKVKYVVIVIVCILTLVSYFVGTQKSKHEVAERNQKLKI